MAPSSAAETADSQRPDINADGIDRAQIRAMLALAPEERLRRVEEFVQSALEIRELNEPRRIR